MSRSLFHERHSVHYFQFLTMVSHITVHICLYFQYIDQLYREEFWLLFRERRCCPKGTPENLSAITHSRRFCSSVDKSVLHPRIRSSAKTGVAFMVEATGVKHSRPRLFENLLPNLV